MGTPVAFVDANVLFSKTLCDWLFLLREELGPSVFLLYSSHDSINEAIYHLRRKRPLADGELTRRRRELLETALDEVVTSFPGDVSFPGTDKHDHHIHAAATHSKTEYLITNDKDFASLHRNELPYEVHTADSFLMLVAENVPWAIDAVIMRQISHYVSRSVTPQLAHHLRKADCSAFAECVERHVKRMANSEATHGIASDLRKNVTTTRSGTRP